jgi:hypothetical protein
MVDKHPELLESDHVDYLFTSLTTYQLVSHRSSAIYRLLTRMANHQPALFDKYYRTLVDTVANEQNTDAYACLAEYAIASVQLGNEKTADEFLTLFIGLIQAHGSKLPNELLIYICSTCQMIGTHYRESLISKRPELVPLESYSACRALIDLIDQNVANDEYQSTIDRAIHDVDQIEQRLTHTESNVQDVTRLVQNHETQVREWTFIVCEEGKGEAIEDLYTRLERNV